MKGVSKDFKNLKFGAVEVIERLGNSKSGHIVWNCRCECGNEFTNISSKLEKGLAICKICNPKKKSIISPNILVNRTDIVDYTNKKINSFLVLNKVTSDKKTDRHTKWLCKCENCGNEIIRSSNRLKKGTPICYICKENNRIKPFKILSTRKDPNEVAFNLTFCHYKKSANKRGYEFELSINQFKELTLRECYYCGTPPSNTQKSATGGIYKYNGIDRMDNEVGYLYDNCLPCCKQCNYMKHTVSFKEFKEKIEKIYLRLIINN